MSLDTPTIAVISIVIDFALTMVLLHAWRTRTTYSGFGAWIAAVLCWSVGSTLVFLLSELQPRFIPKIIGISLILLHPLLIYEGIKRFYGLRIRWWGTPLNILLVLACLTNQAYFLYINANLAARTVVFNIVLAILFARSSLEPLLYAKPRRQYMQWLLSLSILPLIPMFLLRAWQYIKVSAPDNFFLIINQDALLRWSLLYGLLVELIVTYSFLSLTSDRVEGELQRSKELLTDAHNSERKAYQDVRNSEQQYRLLVNNSHGIIYEIRPDGCFGFVSHGWTRLLGHDAAQVVGHDFREFVHADDIASWEAFLQKTVATGEAQRGVVYRVFHADRSEHWHCSNIMPCFNEQFEIISFVGNAVDVTDQIHSEAKLKRASIAADAANQAKSEFLALVSHEIRTPLNALVGFSALARTTSDPKTISKYLAILESSSRSLMGLVNNVLDISKIEAERMLLLPVPADLRQLMLLIPVPVELRQLAGDFESLYQPLTTEKRLAFTVTVQESLPAWVSVDPIRVRQILGNLLSNAVKFTEQGQISLLIEAAKRQQDEASIMVRFTVQDSGIGMSKKPQAQLFQPFKQLDAGVPRSYEGAGLGLYIVQQLCELMGGSISVTSLPGIGSRFVVELPLQLCPHPVLFPEYELQPNEAESLEILVVDDNDFNRLLLFDTLSGWGHVVTPVESGGRAVEEAGRKRFDLILMDLRMPGMDGIEATRQIRATEREQGCPGAAILALTADADSTIAATCREAGVDQLFMKPVTTATLAMIIAHHAGGAKMAATAGTGTLRTMLSARTLADMGPDNSRIEQYCNMLQSDMQQELKRLTTALADGNRQELNEAAHTLKGLCGHLRDPLPAEQAMKIQYGSKNVPLDELTAYVAILQQQLQEICPEGS